MNTANQLPPTVTILSPRAATVEAKKFVSPEAFHKLSFWDELDPTDQQTVKAEYDGLLSANIMRGTATLAMGLRLRNIKTVLDKHRGGFDKFAKTFNFSKRTAYRYINNYLTASRLLEQPILRAAMARGMEIPGTYVEAIERVPPPRALANTVIDGNVANQYLDKLVVTRRTIRRERRTGITNQNKRKQVIAMEVRRDPRVLLMQNYRLAKNAMSSLTTKQRRKFVESLIGMLMTEFGIASATTFTPEAIPEDFRQGRGRPRLVRDEEEDED